MALTHTQKRLLLAARQGPQALSYEHVAWRNLAKKGLVRISTTKHGFRAELTKNGMDEVKAIEREVAAEQEKKDKEAQRLADFERRFAAGRVDA